MLCFVSVLYSKVLQAKLHIMLMNMASVHAEWLVGESGRSVRKPLCHELVRLLDTVVAGSLPICASVSVCASVCLPACPPVCLPACLPTCLSACLSVCLAVCLSACLSVCLPACLPVCQTGWWALMIRLIDSKHILCNTCFIVLIAPWGHWSPTGSLHDHIPA